MKRIKFIPLILATLFAASLFVQCDKKAQMKSPFSIHYNDQRDSTKYYSYKIDFPDTLYYSNLAKAIKNYAAAACDSFFTWMPKDTASLRLPWELIVDFNKVLESSRFVAYRTEYYRYTGGAHGMPATKTFVYDKTKGQLVKLKDFFEDSTALKAISRYARNAIAQKVFEVKLFSKLDSTHYGWVKEGTTPDYSNFKIFLPVNVTSKGVGGLKIIFSPYQVAPYVAGMPAVTIPADQFYSYLAPDYKKVFIQNK